MKLAFMVLLTFGTFQSAFADLVCTAESEYNLSKLSLKKESSGSFSIIYYQASSFPFGSFDLAWAALKDKFSSFEDFMARVLDFALSRSPLWQFLPSIENCDFNLTSEIMAYCYEGNLVGHDNSHETFIRIFLRAEGDRFRVYKERRRSYIESISSTDFYVENCVVSEEK